MSERNGVDVNRLVLWESIQTVPREKWVIVWDVNYKRPREVRLGIRHSCASYSHWIDLPSPNDKLIHEDKTNEQP